MRIRIRTLRRFLLGALLALGSLTLAASALAD